MQRRLPDIAVGPARRLHRSVGDESSRPHGGREIRAQRFSGRATVLRVPEQTPGSFGGPARPATVRRGASSMRSRLERSPVHLLDGSGPRGRTLSRGASFADCLNRASPTTARTVPEQASGPERSVMSSTGTTTIALQAVRLLRASRSWTEAADPALITYGVFFYGHAGRSTFLCFNVECGAHGRTGIDPNLGYGLDLLRMRRGGPAALRRCTPPRARLH